jgi:glucose uptake protein GlcU
LPPRLAGVLFTQEPGRVYWVSAGLIAVLVIVSGGFGPREGQKEKKQETTNKNVMRKT